MQYPQLEGTHRIIEVQILWFNLNELNYPIFYIGFELAPTRAVCWGSQGCWQAPAWPGMRSMDAFPLRPAHVPVEKPLPTYPLSHLPKHLPAAGLAGGAGRSPAGRACLSPVSGMWMDNCPTPHFLIHPTTWPLSPFPFSLILPEFEGGKDVGETSV